MKTNCIVLFKECVSPPDAEADCVPERGGDVREQCGPTPDVMVPSSAASVVTEVEPGGSTRSHRALTGRDT
jgi:hypothetical protein